MKATIGQATVLAVISLFFLDAHAQPDNHERHWVNVDVYYESLCPDSIQFFTKQLYPSLQGNLSNYVNLTLLPYGKSKTTQELNQYDFICHHGPKECEGNKIQACAIQIIENNKKTEGLGYNKMTTAFINCLMDQVKREGNKTVFPTQNCATINHVPSYIDIVNCAKSVDGSKYLNDIGVKTAAFNPILPSVPTIVFNKQYKEDDNKLAQTNFVKALCQYIHGEKPAECTTNSAHSSKFSFAVLGVVAAVLFYY